MLLKLWPIIFRTVLNSAQIQLLMTLISLPFLISWGLPLSYMSIISTPLYAPLFSLFLLLSSLIFFTSLFYIPNQWLMQLLEYTSNVWLWALDHAQSSWLIAFACPPFPVLALPVVGSVLIMHYKGFTTTVHRTIALTILLLGFCVLLKIDWRGSRIDHIHCRQGLVHYMTSADTTVLIDPGYLAASASYESLINYTLLPSMLKSSGHWTIDALIILRISKRTLEMLCYLAQECTIKAVYIPAPYYLSENILPLYHATQKVIVERAGQWLCVDQASTIIEIPSLFVSVTPASSKITSSIKHIPLVAHYTINGTSYTVGAASHKKIVQS